MLNLKTYPIIAISLVTVLATPKFSEARLSYSVGYTGTHSSNASLTAGEDEGSSISHSLDARVSGQSEGRYISSTVDFSLGYLQGNDIENRIIGSGGAHLDIAIRPQRLHWTIADTLTRTLIDSSESSIDPDNSDLRNTFSTGPRLTLDLWGPNHLELAGNFIRTSHIEEDFNDTESLSGNLNFTHLHSARTESGLSYSYRESEQVDADIGDDVSRVENVSLNVNSQFRRMQLGASYGYGRDIQSDFETDTGSVQISYQLNSEMNLSISASKGLSSAGESDINDLNEQINFLTVQALLCGSDSTLLTSCGLIDRLNSAGKFDDSFRLNDDDLAGAIFQESSDSSLNYSNSLTLSWNPSSYSYTFTLFDSEQRDVLKTSAESFLQPDRSDSIGAVLSANVQMSERMSASLSYRQSTRSAFNFDPFTSTVNEQESDEEGITAQMSRRLTPTIQTGLNLSYFNLDRDEVASGNSDDGGDSYQIVVSFVWTL